MSTIVYKCRLGRPTDQTPQENCFSQTDGEVIRGGITMALNPTGSQDGAKGRTIVDKLAKSAVPKIDHSDVTARSAWWWIFFMPGKVILWIEYMFPKRITSVFGSARRRNVPLLQVLYSLYFYFAILVLGLLLLIANRTH
jgi:hypothetical protein